MNPPVVLSVRLKGDWEGPQTGDVVLDVAQVLSDIHHPLVIKDENGIMLVYDGTQEEALEIYSKEKIDQLTNFTSYTIVDKLPPVLDAKTDVFYILPDGTINYIINNKWVNQATSLNIDEIVKEGVDRIIDEKLEPIDDKIIDLETADNELDKKIDQEITDRKKGDKDLQDEIDKLKKTDNDLLQSLKDEIQARKDGDDLLKDDVTDEAKTRLDEDTKLANKIADNKTEINNIKTDITDINTKIVNNANSILGLNTDLTKEIQDRQDGDKNLQDQIDKLKTESSTATTDITTIKSTITTIESDIDDLQDQIDKTVEQDISVSGDASTVEIKETKINLKTGTTSSETNPLPVASKTAAGIVNPATYKTIEDTATAVDAILNGAVSIPDLPEKPTQDELTDAWKAATGKDELINGAKISDSEHDITYTYYTNAKEWQGVATGVTEINITTATNTTLGITKGDDTDTGGKIFVETDGSMSVIKWDDTQKAIKDNADAIDSLKEDVEKNTDDISDLSDKVDTNTTDIATNKSNIETNTTNIKTNTDNISDLSDRMDTAEGNISDLQDAIDALEKGGGQTLYKAYGDKEDGALTQKFVSDQLNANNVILGKDVTRVESENEEAGNVIIGANAGSVALTEAVTVVGSHAQGNANSTVIGNYANAGASDSTIIGMDAYGDSQYSTALGVSAGVAEDAEHSVAIGDYSTATRPYEVSIGGKDPEDEDKVITRFLSNVRDAEQDGDAVNFKQMKDYVAAAASGIEMLTVEEFKTLWSAA